MMKIKNLLLFDAETQHYRQSIYKYFAKEFLKKGYKLIVVYDKRLNTIDNDLFFGIEYSFLNFRKILKRYNCNLVISFVWLRYKFLLPFLVYCRIYGIKIIVWSNGINLQSKKQPLKNQLYYLRQRLANALIIYSKNELKYIVAKKAKVFIANNTLNFYDFPHIELTKEELKKKYNCDGVKVILCVGRMNYVNRKFEDLIKLAKELNEEYKIVFVGPGVTNEQRKIAKSMNNFLCYDEIYNLYNMSEIYKMSDIFCMPGGIGLAINNAFFYGLPVVVEKWEGNPPEIIYLKEGENGMFYEEGNIEDLKQKIEYILENEKVYNRFSFAAKRTIELEASIENMFNGFWEAIKYVE